jgi:hydrogenase maturation protease
MGQGRINLTPLENLIKKKNTVILGIGNRLKNDDGAGSVFAETLIKTNYPVTTLDCATCFENYLGKIIKLKPDNVIIVDTGLFGGQPGEIKLLSGDEIPHFRLRGHSPGIKMGIEFITNEIDCDFTIIIIQPENMNTGDTLTESVSNTVNELIKIFSSWIT